MLRAFRILPAGEWDQLQRRGFVALDFDRRSRRRLALSAIDGRDFLLDLPKARHLRAGDGLLLDTGEIIEVAAAPEALLELRCAGPDALVRLAWHLGNRHIPTELRPDSLRIRFDHVLADMAKLLGAEVVRIEAAFDPEGGAYAGTIASVHHHHHGEDDCHHPHAAGEGPQ